MSYNDFDLDKARELRERTKHSFTQRLRRELLGSVLFGAPFFALSFFACMKWATTGEAEAVRFYSLLYLIGLLFIFLIASIYGLSSRLLLLLKEVKQLRLDLLSTQELAPESATGGAESFLTWTAAAIRSKLLLMLLAVLFVLLWLFAAFAYTAVQRYFNMHWTEYESFGGQEVVDLHVLADGRVRAFSRVSITKCPSSIASIPIQIVQPGAVLESVSINGRKVPFEPAAGGEGAYTVMPGLPEDALKSALMEAVYTFGKAEDLRGCFFHLKGLIPINSYAANMIIDEGVPIVLKANGRNRKVEPCSGPSARAATTTAGIWVLAGWAWCR